MEKLVHKFMWCPECLRSYVAPYDTEMNTCPECSGTLKYHHKVLWHEKIEQPIFAGKGVRR